MLIQNRTFFALPKKNAQKSIFIYLLANKLFICNFETKKDTIFLFLALTEMHFESAWVRS
jgi:hypothetical protein